MTDDAIAAPGRRVIPVWNALLRSLQQMRIIAGPGALLSVTPQGSTISARAARATFEGAWWVTVPDRKSARVATGFVNGLEPVVDGKKLSEKPLVKLTKGTRCWINLAIKLDKDGKLPTSQDDITAAVLTILATDKPLVSSGGYNLHPLAVINNFAPRQIAFFDYSLTARARGTGWQTFVRPV